MATTRIKDISSTVTSLASDDYIAVDGATNGTRKMVRSSIYTDVAAAFTGAPTTYDICPLNSGTNKIDATYLPTSGDTPKGEWNANTNSPSLADGSGTAGDYYDVTTAGTQNLGSGNITFTVGDVVKYNGSTWYKIDSVANFLDGYSTAATSRTALEVNSVDEDAEATALKLVGPALYFDGSDYVTIADDAKQSFTDGTDDLPLSINLWLKPKSLSTTSVIVAKATLGANREYSLRVNTDGTLRFTLRDNSATAESYSQTDAAVLTVGEWTNVCVTFPGAGPNSSNDFSAAADGIVFYKNGSSVASTATNSGSYAGMEDVSSTPFLIGGQTALFFTGHIKNVTILNREISATEASEIAKGNDLGFSEEWAGAFSGVYTSDFSAGADSFASGSAVTVDGNIDAIGGQDDNLRITVDNTNNNHYADRSTTLTTGKRQRVQFDYYIPSTNSNVDGLRIGDAGSTAAGIDVASATLDAWTRVSCDFVPTSTTLRISVSDGGVLTFQDSGGDDVMYVRNLRITNVGVLADFRSESFDSDTGKLYDTSSNAFIGTNSGATLTGRSYPVYETGNWTPTLTFGGGSTGLTYTSQEGYYTRIGNTVFATGGIILSAKGSSTGAAAIALPYTARNTTDDIQGVSVGRGLNMASLTGAISGYIVDNTTSCKLQDWGATGSVDLDEGNFTDTTEINISVTYQIS